MLIETLHSKLSAIDANLQTATERTDLSPIGDPSESLRAEIAENNSKFREAIACIAGRRQHLEAVISNADTDDFGSVVLAIEQDKLDLPCNIQALIVHWAKREELATTMHAELKKKVDPTKAELEKTTASVRKDLTRIGQGVEAQQAYGTNAPAAEMQLDYLVRLNTRVRPLAAAAHDAEVAVQAMWRQVLHSRDGKAAAQSYLRKLAMRQLDF